MKFEVGDKVLLLHSNEEGEVIDIINNEMVMVEIRGVKFPAYIDQLDFPYFKRFTEKKIQPSKKEKIYVDQIPKEKAFVGNDLPQGVCLMFVPKFTVDDFDDEVVSLLKVYLLNGTDTGYKFQLTFSYQGNPAIEFKNEVAAGKDFYLIDVPFENINDSPSFAFEFSLLVPVKGKAPFYESFFKLRAKQTFNKIEEIKKKEEPSFSYLLFEQYPDKEEDNRLDLSSLSSHGFKVYEASKFRDYLAPSRSVIDLHIEKITDDWEKLSNFEIITLQLAEFEKYYQLALAHHQPMLTIIHGIGTGKLKDEIHALLRDRKEVRRYINEYHALYGFGATEIFFHY